MTVSDIDAAALRRMYIDERWSTRRLAAHLGCSTWAVARAMDRAGISRRPGGAERTETCACGAPTIPERRRCRPCQRRWWRQRDQERRGSLPQVRTVIFEVVGLDAGGEQTTLFYGAGTDMEKVDRYVDALFVKPRVATVQLWTSPDVELTTAGPRRELVRTITRERRAA